MLYSQTCCMHRQFLYNILVLGITFSRVTTMGSRNSAFSLGIYKNQVHGISIFRFCALQIKMPPGRRTPPAVRTQAALLPPDTVRRPVVPTSLPTLPRLSSPTAPPPLWDILSPTDFRIMFSRIGGVFRNFDIIEIFKISIISK